MKWLLEIYDSGVVSDIISPDSNPDGYGTFATTNNDQFWIGFFVGLGVAIGIWCFIKLCKYILKKAFHDDEENE